MMPFWKLSQFDMPSVTYNEVEHALELVQRIGRLAWALLLLLGHCAGSKRRPVSTVGESQSMVADALARGWGGLFGVDRSSNVFRVCGAANAG